MGEIVCWSPVKHGAGSRDRDNLRREDPAVDQVECANSELEWLVSSRAGGRCDEGVLEDGFEGRLNKGRTTGRKSVLAATKESNSDIV